MNELFHVPGLLLKHDVDKIEDNDVVVQSFVQQYS